MAYRPLITFYQFECKGLNLSNPSYREHLNKLLQCQVKDSEIAEVCLGILTGTLVRRYQEAQVENQDFLDEKDKSLVKTLFWRLFQSVSSEFFDDTIFVYSWLRFFLPLEVDDGYDILSLVLQRVGEKERQRIFYFLGGYSCINFLIAAHDNYKMHQKLVNFYSHDELINSRWGEFNFYDFLLTSEIRDLYWKKNHNSAN